MVSGIHSNVGFQGGINTATSAQPYMAAPYQYATQAPADTVELAGKAKKSGAKKGIFAAIGTAVVAAAALYLGVKSGKLKNIDNATTVLQKANNLAVKGGNYVAKGVDAVKNSSVGQTVVDNATKGWDWVKSKFPKKAA